MQGIAKPFVDSPQSRGYASSDSENPFDVEVKKPENACRMTPERYQQIKRLFHEAMEHDVTSRAAWLADACGEDSGLRREVETLLRESTSADTLPFLETEAILAAAPNLPRFDQDRTMIGQRIGLYRIVSELGRGGMGNVYLAERDDEEFKKRVAVKIVRRGMDSAEILARFRHERQILASLDHPNIARLLDGGTTADGLPYFVMEHIEGQPIDEYCESHQLKTRERLELFRTVCAAVHYAHQNLVIHRDIKPTNILVAEDGTGKLPKLLDFGIAKILNPEMSPDTIYPTRTWERPMTPAYASPEQVMGQNVTTATDVYSLGVVLYELLTGQKPYQINSVSPHEIARVVCENEPERPSTAVVRRTTADGARETNGKFSIEYAEKLRRQLQGDLDNIVLMALRKEPERRYASVQQFSEDIRRHLAGRPVIAREDTVGYRLSKFVTRHRAGVVAATLITLSLLAGLVTTIWQMRVARQQRAIAERRFNDVRKLANNVLFKYHDAIENLPGATPVREMLVKDALEYLDNLSRESGSDPALQQELAAAYEKVGLVQGHPYYSNLGDRAGALRSYEKALAIRRTLNFNDAKSLYDLSRNQTLLADLKSEGGDVAGAINGYREALPICERALDAAPNDTAIRNWVGVIYERLADSLEKTGDYKTSLEYTQKSLAFSEQVAAAEPGDPKWQRNLTISYIKLGDRMYTTLDYGKALEFYRQALARYETLFAADKLNVSVRREMATTLDSAGKMLQLMGRFDEAMSQHRRALQLREAGIAADPKNELLRGDLTITTELIGETLAKQGDTAGALEWHRKTLALREAVLAADPAFTDANRYIAISHTQIGDALLARNDFTAAAEHYGKAQTRLETLSTSDSANLDVSRALAGCYSRLGRLNAAMAVKMKSQQAEHWQQAQSWFQQSLDIWNSKMSGGALSPVDAQEMQQTANQLAQCDAALARLTGNKVIKAQL